MDISQADLDKIRGAEGEAVAKYSPNRSLLGKAARRVAINIAKRTGSKLAKDVAKRVKPTPHERTEQRRDAIAEAYERGDTTAEDLIKKDPNDLPANADLLRDRKEAAQLPAPSKQLPQFYHREFGGDKMADLLKMRDFKRAEVPEGYSVKAWRAHIRERIQNWTMAAEADRRGDPMPQTTVPIPGEEKPAPGASGPQVDQKPVPSPKVDRTDKPDRKRKQKQAEEGAAAVIAPDKPKEQPIEPVKPQAAQDVTSLAEVFKAVLSRYGVTGVQAPDMPAEQWLAMSQQEQNAYIQQHALPHLQKSPKFMEETLEHLKKTDPQAYEAYQLSQQQQRQPTTQQAPTRPAPYVIERAPSTGGFGVLDDNPGGVDTEKLWQEEKRRRAQEDAKRIRQHLEAEQSRVDQEAAEKEARKQRATKAIASPAQSELPQKPGPTTAPVSAQQVPKATSPAQTQANPPQQPPPPNKPPAPPSDPPPEDDGGEGKRQKQRRAKETAAAAVESELLDADPPKQDANHQTRQPVTQDNAEAQDEPSTGSKVADYIQLGLDAVGLSIQPPWLTVPTHS